MVTALSIAVAALLLTVVFFATWVIQLRSRARKHDVKLRTRRSASSAPPSSTGDDPPHRSEAVAEPSPLYHDKMEIPAALVGAQCKEAIERFAPVFGLSPVKLLRAALVQGLTGGRPITAEVLDALEELTSTDLPPPSKPDPSCPN
jgi:hypothetical protein